MQQIDPLNMTHEIWKPAAGWEEEYEVSNFGRVRTREHTVKYLSKTGKVVNRHVKSKLKILAECNTGYLTAALSRSGKTVNVQVHTLVARTFLKNPHNFTIVNHIDHDGHNNRVDNLEWCSPRGNVLHAVWNGRNNQAIPVRCIEDDRVFPSLAECDRFYNMKPGMASELTLSGEAHPVLHFHFERILSPNFVGSITSINEHRSSDCNFNEQ